MNCTWCDNTAAYYAVFGYTGTMQIWDVRLCAFHKNMVCDNLNRYPDEPVYAPPDGRVYHGIYSADMYELALIQ